MRLEHQLHAQDGQARPPPLVGVVETLLVDLPILVLLSPLHLAEVALQVAAPLLTPVSVFFEANHACSKICTELFHGALLLAHLQEAY